MLSTKHTNLGNQNVKIDNLVHVCIHPNNTHLIESQSFDYKGLFSGILPRPHNNVMALNNVMDIFEAKI